MSINYIPLDKEKHKDIKVQVRHNFEFAKDTHLAAASFREYPQLASCMPLVFIKAPDGDQVHSVAILGVEPGKNLFHHDGKWQGHAVPLNIQRYPFDVRPDGDKLGVFLDENSELLGEDGEPLFTEEGTASPFLENRQRLLTDLTNSEMATQRFIKKITELNLLDPIQLTVTYASGQQRNVKGMLSINEKRLNELDDATVLELQKAGFLGGIYAMLLSLGQLNRLVQLSTNTDAPIRAMQLRVDEEKAEAPEAATAE